MKKILLGNPLVVQLPAHTRERRERLHQARELSTAFNLRASGAVRTYVLLCVRAPVGVLPSHQF